jgi:hypothetical protein
MPARKGGRKKKGGALTVPSKVKQVASTVNKVLKDTKAISKGLDAIGKSNLAGMARSVGYGRKRRARKKGGSLLGDILGKITSIPAGAIIGATAGTQGAISGLGRKKGGNWMMPRLTLSQRAVDPVSARFPVVGRGKRGGFHHPNDPNAWGADALADALRMNKKGGWSLTPFHWSD